MWYTISIWETVGVGFILILILTILAGLSAKWKVLYPLALIVSITLGTLIWAYANTQVDTMASASANLQFMGRWLTPIIFFIVLTAGTTIMVFHKPREEIKDIVL